MTEEQTNNLDTDLLAELNGAGKVEAVDTEQITEAQKERKADPLDASGTMKAAEKKTVDQKVKEEMKAKGKMLKGYAVTVEGEFFKASAEVKGKNVTDTYCITVNLPSIDRALTVIKDKLLDKVLKMKYPGYVSYRTHKVTKVVPLSADSPESDNIRFMSEDKLKRFVEFQKVPINVADYPNTTDLREAVIDFMLNPKGFEEREQKRQADRKETASLLAMNNVTDGGPNRAVRG